MDQTNLASSIQDENPNDQTSLQLNGSNADSTERHSSEGEGSSDSDHNGGEGPSSRSIHRVSSGSSIIPREQSPNERNRVYSPNDPRSMSPPRSSAEVAELIERSHRKDQEKRQKAVEIQQALNEIAEDVEKLKRNHARLEAENYALQEYIGGVTRKLDASDISGKGKGKK